MGTMRLVKHYSDYLDTIDRYAPGRYGEEYLELLGPGEVYDLLIIRDMISEEVLTPEEQTEVARLDDLLMKHRWLVIDNIPPEPEKPRSRWWWHLHEGPQVREQAAAIHGT